jgi:hypothetical protein
MAVTMAAIRAATRPGNRAAVQKEAGRTPGPLDLFRQVSAGMGEELTGLTISQILYVHVRSQPHVIRQIPAVVIRIIVDHDIVSAPVPAVAVAEVIGRDPKIESAEPEAARSSAFDAKRVAPADAAGEMAMLKRTVEMVVRIVLAGVVSHPFVAARMNVRRFGMTLLIGIAANRFLRSPRLILRRPRLIF